MKYINLSDKVISLFGNKLNDKQKRIFKSFLNNNFNSIYGKNKIKESEIEIEDLGDLIIIKSIYNKELHMRISYSVKNIYIYAFLDGSLITEYLFKDNFVANRTFINGETKSYKVDYDKDEFTYYYGLSEYIYGAVIKKQPKKLFNGELFGIEYLFNDISDNNIYELFCKGRVIALDLLNKDILDYQDKLFEVLEDDAKQKNRKLT